VALELSRDDGVTWQTLAPAAFEDHLDVVFGEPQTASARVRVRDFSGIPRRSDVSDAPFTIELDLTEAGDGTAGWLRALAARTRCEALLTSRHARPCGGGRSLDVVGRRRATIFQAAAEGRHALRWDHAVSPGFTVRRAAQDTRAPRGSRRRLTRREVPVPRAAVG
jgi:hypothetical protein